MARRVTAELGRWGLTLATSGGELLRGTPAGIFHDLIAETAATGSQIALLALLKHPLTRLGLPEGAAQRAGRTLEIAGMRQAWCGEGLDALGRSLVLAKRTKPRHRAIDRISDEEWEAADTLLAGLKEALRPLLRLARRASVPFAELAAAHVKAAEMLAADEAGSSAGLTRGADGEAMAAFMRTLASDAPGPAIALGDYPALFRSLIRLEKTRPAIASHPRLQILGRDGSAAHLRRSGRHRRAERGHLAGSRRPRSLAQPLDACRPRTAFAGAAHPASPRMISAR